MIDVFQHTSRELAPVAVYTYSRVDHFIRTVESLKRNHLAAQTTLYIVSDGPKCAEHKPYVQAIRNYTEDLNGFREIVKIFRPNNFGMAESLPLAEEAILADHGRIIDMEDDNVSSPNFLDFINAGLQNFEDDKNVYSVCGYCPPVHPLGQEPSGDFWFYPWNLSWGYGLWKKKHDRFQPLINNYKELRKNGVLRNQNRAGGLYVTDSLRRDFLGQKYFPDSILCTKMFEAGMCSVIPSISKILNIGQDGSGQSSSLITSKYDSLLDIGSKRNFDFSKISTESNIYINNLIALYNGGYATRLARSLGVYHQLSKASQFLRDIKGSLNF